MIGNEKTFDCFCYDIHSRVLLITYKLLVIYYHNSY